MDSSSGNHLWYIKKEEVCRREKENSINSRV